MRYMFGRIRDCWDRPICSRPGPVFQLMGRIFDYSIYGTFTYTGEKVPGINLGSYNYLGFAENAGTCIDHVIDAVNAYGVGPAGRKIEVGMRLISSSQPASSWRPNPAHDRRRGGRSQEPWTCTRCWRSGWPTSWARKTPWSSPWATPPTRALSPPSPDRYLSLSLPLAQEWDRSERFLA